MVLPSLANSSMTPLPLCPEHFGTLDSSTHPTEDITKPTVPSSSLQSRLSIFEENIQRNAAGGCSSIPSGIQQLHPSNGVAIQSEGKRSFQISEESYRRSRSVSSNNRDVWRCLSNQLHSVISQLQPTEIQAPKIGPFDFQSKLPALVPLQSDSMHSSTTVGDYGSQEDSLVLSGHNHGAQQDRSLDLTHHKLIESWAEEDSDDDTSQEAEFGFFIECDDDQQSTSSSVTFSAPFQSAVMLQSVVRGFLARRLVKDMLAKQNSLTKYANDAARLTLSIKAELELKNDELRKQIAALQYRIDTIPTETRIEIDDMAKDFKQKQETLQDLTDRHCRKIRNEARRGARNRLSEIDKRKCTIAYRKEGNAKLRKEQRRLDKGIRKLQNQQICLEQENEVISMKYNELFLYTEEMTKRNAKLVVLEESCHRVCKPMWRDVLLDNKVHGASEARQVVLYRSTINKIQCLLNEEEPDVELKDAVNGMIGDNEYQLAGYYEAKHSVYPLIEVTDTWDSNSASDDSDSESESDDCDIEDDDTVLDNFVRTYFMNNPPTGSIDMHRSFED